VNLIDLQKVLSYQDRLLIVCSRGAIEIKRFICTSAIGLNMDYSTTTLNFKNWDGLGYLETFLLALFTRT
jgi:hypothetical protein